MWPKNTCVIEKIRISDGVSARSDPDVAEFVEKTTESLGRKGRFVIKFSGIPQENSVLVEGKNRKACNQCIEDLKRLLIRKNYMECEHVWERVSEEDYGEMDYRSDGRGVEHFVVTLYRCRLCGNLHKECRGDYCGDSQEYLEITDADLLMTKQHDDPL